MVSPLSALAFSAGVALAGRPVFAAAALVSTSWLASPPPRPRARYTSFWPLDTADSRSELPLMTNWPLPLTAAATASAPVPETTVLTFRLFFLNVPKPEARKAIDWLELSDGMTRVMLVGALELVPDPPLLVPLLPLLLLPPPPPLLHAPPARASS